MCGDGERASVTNFIAMPPPGAEYRFDRDAGPGTPASAGDKRFELRMRWLYNRCKTRDTTDPPQAATTLSSGLLYLAQLVAHDMIETAPGREAWRVGRDEARAANCRCAVLELETLYGSGMDPRRFRAGRFVLGQARVASGCPMRDVPREGRAALVADGRNDDHAIIAQLAALFMRVHNVLADALPAYISDDERIRRARAALTLLYRGVVRRELLPHLLAPHVASAYLVPAPSYLDPDGAAGVPVEFSHAAFRFGHVMPRFRYRFNGGADSAHPLHDSLRFTSARRQDFAGGAFLDESWLVDWRLFLDGPGQRAVNRSHALAPADQAAFHVAAQFTDEVPADPPPLLLRDLLACGIARPWSVPALIARIAAQPQGAALLAPWHVNGQWADALRCWLAPHGTGADADAVVADPPLVFFVAFEAAEELVDGTRRGGATLGTLGSIIVAEVLCRALERGPLAIGFGADPRARIAALDPALAGIAARLPTCPGLLDLAQLAGLVPQAGNP
jgi:hypothetical protein